jgi:hypothetical protein
VLQEYVGSHLCTHIPATLSLDESNELFLIRSGEPTQNANSVVIDRYSEDQKSSS